MHVRTSALRLRVHLLASFFKQAARACLGVCDTRCAQVMTPCRRPRLIHTELVNDNQGMPRCPAHESWWARVSPFSFFCRIVHASMLGRTRSISVVSMSLP